MRNFVDRILYFFLFFLLYVSAVWLWNLLEIRFSDLPLGKSRLIIIGDSHVQDGFNPELFQNASNISQPAEPMVVTFYKLKLIFETAEVDTVIVGFSPHNIANFNETIMFKGYQANGLFYRMYPLWGFELPNDVLIDKISYYQCLLRNMSLVPRWKHANNFIGSFEIVNKKYSGGQPIALHKHFPNGDSLVSKSALSYLMKISTLCLENSVKAVFVSTPVHQLYREGIPQSLLDVFEVKKELLRDSGHTVLDFQYLGFPDSAFKNANHLNFTGSNIFSEYFKEDLRSNSSFN